MGQVMLSALVFFGLFAVALAHPQPRALLGDTYIIDPNCRCDPDTEPESYHIHLMYWTPSFSIPGVPNLPHIIDNSIDAALEVQAKFNLKFVVPNCSTISGTTEVDINYHGEKIEAVKGDLCSFGIIQPDTPSGTPFVTPNVAWYIPPSMFAETVSWVMRHRGQLSMFVHPNTCDMNCVAYDHVLHSFWGGTQWSVRMSMQQAMAEANSTLTEEVKDVAARVVAAMPNATRLFEADLPKVGPSSPATLASVAVVAALASGIFIGMRLARGQSDTQPLNSVLVGEEDE